MLALALLVTLTGCSGGGPGETDAPEASEIPVQGASDPQGENDGVPPTDSSGESEHQQYDSWDAFITERFGEDIRIEEASVAEATTYMVYVNAIENLNDFMLDALLIGATAGLTYDEYGLEPIGGCFIFCEDFSIAIVVIDSTLGFYSQLHIDDDSDREEEIQDAYDSIFFVTGLG